MIIDACCTIGADADAEPGAGELVRLMDEAGVDRAVLHATDRCYAWDNEAGNALLLGACEQFPERLLATATANPWRRDAWTVLQRAIDAGVRMLSFAPALQGFVLSEGKLDGILENLQTHHPDVSLFIHTGHHSNATPCQLALLADRFPGVNFVMGHSGSTDYKSDVVPVCSVCANVYPESSFARPPGFLQSAGDIGWQRVIMGSGFPYNDFHHEWRLARELTPPEHAPAFLGGNIASLLAPAGV